MIIFSIILVIGVFLIVLIDIVHSVNRKCY